VSEKNVTPTKSEDYATSKTDDFRLKQSITLEDKYNLQGLGLSVGRIFNHRIIFYIPHETIVQIKVPFKSA
jgi:hypothetical protein